MVFTETRESPGLNPQFSSGAGRGGETCSQPLASPGSPPPTVLFLAPLSSHRGLQITVRHTKSPALPWTWRTRVYILAKSRGHSSSGSSVRSAGDLLTDAPFSQAKGNALLKPS